MKRRLLVLFIALSLVLFILSGCTKRYKKVSLSDDFSLREMLMRYINNDTAVDYCAERVFPDTLPMYQISPRNITDSEYRETLEMLGIKETELPKQWINLDGNKLKIDLDDIFTSSRGYFDMTEEELEKKAREIFAKLPFVHGEYEYIGMRATYKTTDSEGEHIRSAAGCFCRVVNGIRVVGGHDSCYLYFDGSGLVSLVAELYDYEEIGSMKVIPIQRAIERITSPDSFSVEEASAQIGVAKTLKVETAVIRYVNQLSQGCEILEPVYYFRGSAFDSAGSNAVFASAVIAIPDSFLE